MGVNCVEIQRNYGNNNITRALVYSKDSDVLAMQFGRHTSVARIYKMIYDKRVLEGAEIIDNV